MDMFIKAMRDHIRFQTNRGPASVEDLWDIKLTELNSMAKSLKSQLKAVEGVEDYLEDKPEADTILKLKFDIVLSILETKKSEKKDSESELTKKAEREKLLALIAKKEEDSLGNLSVEELKAKLEKLK